MQADQIQMVREAALAASAQRGPVGRRNYDSERLSV